MKGLFEKYIERNNSRVEFEDVFESIYDTIYKPQQELVSNLYSKYLNIDRYFEIFFALEELRVPRERLLTVYSFQIENEKTNDYGKFKSI